jgi:hypothetical protein
LPGTVTGVVEPWIEEVVAQLDLERALDAVCHACLSFVSFPLDDGDLHETRRAAREFTPILWEEGLEEPARDALARASELGASDAAVALADVEAVGPRSKVALAIVLRLAEELNRGAEERLRHLGLW